MITRRLERQRWQQLYRGVYAVFSGPPPRQAWLWAAVLRAGRGAVLSHLTAAELHGLLDTPAEAIFVTVPSIRRVSAPGLIVRTSGRIADAVQPGRRPPRTGVEETVLDLVQLAWSFDDACGWLTQACGRRLTTSDNQAGARGILTTRYGWRDVYGHPCETALLQARILRQRGWTGLPRPCSATCPVGRGTSKIDLRTLRRSRQPARQAPRLTSEARRKRDAEPRFLPGTRSCGTAGTAETAPEVR